MNSSIHRTSFGLRNTLLIACLVAGMGLLAFLMQGENPAGKPIDEAQRHSDQKPVTSESQVVRVLNPEDSARPEVRQYHPANLGVAEEFEKVQLSIIPEIARELIARCKAEVTDINQRRRLSSRIITALCNRGYTGEAWGLIEPDSGDVRGGELLAFFENKTLSFKDRSVYLDELSEPSDRSWALSGLINVPAERLHEVDFDGIFVSSILEKNTISSKIAMAITGLGSIGSNIPNGAELTRKLLETSALLVRSNKLDASHLTRILQADLGNDGFYHWNFLDQVKRGVSPQNYEQLQASVVPQMIQGDANRAMKIVCSDPFSMGSGAIISQAIEAWYIADSQGANAWVTSHVADQNSTTKNLILASVARVAVKDGDFKTALQWTGQMSDPQLKEKVEVIIRSKQDNTQH